MVLPLQVLAVGSLLAGLLGIPAVLGHALHIPNVFETFTEPVFEAAHETLPQVFTAAPPAHSMEMGLMAASVTIAALGIALAWQLFRRHPEVPGRIASSMAPLYRLVLNKYYVDEIYGALFVRGAALGGGKALYAVDRYVVDGGDGEVRFGSGVNGIGWFVREIAAKGSDVWDRYVVDGLVNTTAALFDNLSYVFRSLQNGLVQHYALSMLIIFLLMVGLGSRWIL
jgi:NADH-quinone oxidoreductase subunit L